MFVRLQFSGFGMRISDLKSGSDVEDSYNLTSEIFESAFAFRVRFRRPGCPKKPVCSSAPTSEGFVVNDLYLAADQNLFL